MNFFRSRWGLAAGLAAALSFSSACSASTAPAAAPSRSAVPSPTFTPTLTSTPAVVPPRQTRPLPDVPGEGVIVDDAGVATFRSLDGRTEVPLPGFRLAKGLIAGGRTWLGAADGSTWLLDTEAHQLVNQKLAHDPVEGLGLLGQLPQVERIGHWSFALPGSNGQLLAQWSGECEVPSVYVADREHRVRRVSPDGGHVNALARGWTRAGQPVVEFTEAPCGTARRAPGLYLEVRPGHYRQLVRTSVGAYYRLPLTATATQLTLCGPSAYELKAVAEGATGNVAVGAEIHPTTTSPCRLDIVVGVALRASVTGQPLHVPTSYVKTRVRGVLPNADDLHADVVWNQPYCSNKVVDLVVQDGRGNQDTLRDILHPRCDPAAGQTGRGTGLGRGRT